MDNYIREYNSLLNNIIVELNKFNLPKQLSNKYLKYLKVINNMPKKDKSDYLKVISYLIYIQNELDKYFYELLGDIKHLNDVVPSNFITVDFEELRAKHQKEKERKIEPADPSVFKELFKHMNGVNYVSTDKFIVFEPKKREKVEEEVVREIEEDARKTLSADPSVFKDLFKHMNGINYVSADKFVIFEPKKTEKKSTETENKVVKEIEEQVLKNIQKEYNRIKSENIPVTDKREQLIKLKANILKTLNEIKKINIISTKSKLKIISSLISLTILISIPKVSLSRLQNTERERLYRTDKEIYTQMEGDIPTVDMPIEISEDNAMLRTSEALVADYIKEKDGSITYTSDYEPLKYPEETIIVRECDPWTTEGVESQRKVTTYKVEDMTIPELLNASDLDSILATSNPETTYEHTTKNKLSKAEREYQYKIIEFIKLSQDLTDYTEKNLPTDKIIETIIIILSDLLIYMCMIENNGPFIEIIITELSKIINNYKLTKTQKTKLKELIDKYNAINDEIYTTTKIKRKSH